MKENVTLEIVITNNKWIEEKHMPEWLSKAIFYEIYPQSFQDTNADGIGDFEGIIRRLDYIKELGCNSIWINPCFASPFMDAGYDVADYYKAAPRYGTNDDLKRLFEEVHKRNMHILLDLVPGHTSNQHDWFTESKKADKNEYTDRYIWTNTVWENPESLLCIRGISDRDGSCGINFFSSQPALNYGYANPTKDYQMSPLDKAPMETREAMKDIMRFWLTLGCDGFRVDMAGNLIKNDDSDATANIKLWQDFMGYIKKEFPDAAMVSEWGEPKKSIAGGFHMDFLLHFGMDCYTSLFRAEEPFFSKRGKGNIGTFVKEYSDMYNLSKGKGLICIPSGNHDMERLALGKDMDELKICFAFLLSMPGAPFIYYGDEIGMKYLTGLTSVEGGYSRTGSRSPMQWNSGVNAGFSTACPDDLYIRMDEDKERPTVEMQLMDENSLLHVIMKLTALREKYPAIQNNGEFEFVYANENEYPLVYLRRCDNEEILIAINPSAKEESCEIKKVATEIIGSVGVSAMIKDGKLTIPACSATFFRV